MEASSRTRSYSCHLLTGLGTYVLALTCMYWLGSNDDNRISLIIGLGFGQISLIAIWCVVGLSRVRFLAAAVALFGCYFAMALWVVIQSSNVDATFYISLAVASVAFFSAMAASMFAVRRFRGVTVVHLPDAHASEAFSGQYGIRDIMIAMSLAALIMAAIKIVGNQQYGQQLPLMLMLFGLITISFFLFSWPVVVACLSERWLLLTVFSIILVAGIFFAQQPIFTSILGPGGDPEFFIFLDAPFVIAVVLHSLIARAFGFRLKTFTK